MRPYSMAAVAVLAVATASAANAADVRLFAPTAMKTTIVQLAPPFEKETKHKLRTSYGPSGAVARQIAGNEAADVVIVAGGIDELIKQGKVREDSRREIARVRIGVIVKKGAPKPDIGTADALKRTLLAAKSIAYVDPRAGGASGADVVRLFDRMGIRKEIDAKSVLVRVGTNDTVAAMVAGGEAEIGLQRIPEIVSAAGVDFVGPLPEELQAVTVYAVGIPVRAQQAAAAEAFIQFIIAPAAADIYKARGLEQVEQPKPPPPPVEDKPADDKPPEDKPPADPK